MQHLLIKLDSNYSDEFDVESFWITTDEEFEDWKEILKNVQISNDIDIYFGTNESITFSSYDEIMDSLSIIEIKEDLAETLIDLFSRSYGLIDLEDLPLSYLPENDWEED